MKDSDTKKLPYRREKRKVSYSSFYGTFKDTRFNIDLKRPSFCNPGEMSVFPDSICKVPFGATKRHVELSKYGEILSDDETPLTRTRKK